MSDPLSIAASVIAVVEVANKVIHAIEYCIRAIKDAPRDIQIILAETVSLKAIIESVASTEVHTSSLTRASSLLGDKGPIEGCRRCLLELELLLPTDFTRRLSLAMLAWPLKESKARRILADISRHKSTLLLAVASDTRQDIRDIRSSMQNVENKLSETQQREVIQWLQRKVANPSLIHNAAYQKHEKHTSTWLQHLQEWQRWLLQEPGSSRLLWVHGIPGAGKTVLASFIIEQLKEFCDMDNGICHSYYYCYYAHTSGDHTTDGVSPHSRNEAKSFLKWIVGQACRQTKCIPDKLRGLYEMNYDPTIRDLEEIFESLVLSFNAYYIVIDAVDESIPRHDLLDIITALTTHERFSSVRILATSRCYADIERSFTPISASISMSNTRVREDILKFVRFKLASSPRLARLGSLRTEIECAIVDGAQGMFRWAECQLHSIDRLRDENQIRKALRNLPGDLVQTYVRIFEEIPELDRPFVQRALIWIDGHNNGWATDRGINANVLLQAVEYDLNGANSSRKKLEYDLDDLQELCGCLIAVSSRVTEPLDIREGETDSPVPSTPSYSDLSNSPKQEDNWRSPTEFTDYTNLKTSNRDPRDFFVSLAHYTVEEFLGSQLIIQSSVSCFALSGSFEAEYCLSALCQALEANPTDRDTDWDANREAYCLVLSACASQRYEMAKIPGTREMIERNYDPTSPHFKRIVAIQNRIARVGGEARDYYVWTLATDVRDASTGEENGMAGTLLNLLLGSSSLEILDNFSKGKDIEELLRTRFTASFTDYGNFLRTGVRDVIEGTIDEIQSRITGLCCGTIKFEAGRWNIDNHFDRCTLDHHS